VIGGGQRYSLRNRIEALATAALGNHRGRDPSEWGDLLVAPVVSERYNDLQIASLNVGRQA